MNIRYKPTFIQVIDNPATKDTAFLWFHSIEVDAGIVIGEEEIARLKECCNELEELFLKKKNIK